MKTEIKDENNKILEQAYFKFNGGNGAKLCNHCNKMLKTGSDFTDIEWKAFKGELYLEPEYCKECIKTVPLYKFNPN